MKTRYLVCVVTLMVIEANADNPTLDAVMGGDVGASTGNEIGGYYASCPRDPGTALCPENIQWPGIL